MRPVRPPEWRDRRPNSGGIDPGRASAAASELIDSKRVCSYSEQRRSRPAGVSWREGSEWQTSQMVKALELAIEALSSLPAADQERMGRQLLAYIEKLLQLRIEVDKGVRALDSGVGSSLDLEDFLRQQNERHGRP
jgi:hypothetical protein